MSIIRSIGFATHGPYSRTTSFYLQDFVTQDLFTFLSRGSYSSFYSLLQPLEAVSSIYAIQEYRSDIATFILPISEYFSNYFIEFLSKDLDLDNSFVIHSYITDTVTTNLDLLDTFYKLYDTANIQIGELGLTNYGSAYENELLIWSGSTSLEQIDIFGPRLINKYPIPDSIFNNPLTNISFTLTDQEHTTIVTSSIVMAINNIPVISGGINITPSGYGITTFIQQDAWTYDFSFTPVSGFDPDSLVIISGSAIDNYVPQNYGIFGYSFSVYTNTDLSATISGSPDSFPPYIQNLTPFNTQIEVLPYTDISFDIVDDHTGVDYESIQLSLNDILLWSGGYQFNADYANVSIVSGVQKYSVTINPATDFDFATLVSGNIKASDRFTISPNVLDYSYIFTTVQNSHLLASGLQVYSNGSWVDMINSNSYYITQTGVDFRLNYLNLLGSGISITGSYITCNDIVISSSILPVSSGSLYDVYFTLIPDYYHDVNLQFHLVQETNISGTEVYRDFFNTLLWGAEVCYDPDVNLSFDTKYPIVIQSSDLADWNTISTLDYSFTTIPLSNSNLSAEIIGLAYKNNDIYSTILSHNPYFEYGKTMNMQFAAEDYAGNKLVYNWEFVIQNRD